MLSILYIVMLAYNRMFPQVSTEEAHPEEGEDNHNQQSNEPAFHQDECEPGLLVRPQ